MTTSKLIRISDPENGILVICPGHVGELDFARRIDVDDVATILGEYEMDEDGIPSDATDERLADRVRHTFGRWTDEGGKRRWEELAEDAPGAEPFTAIDENSTDRS